MTAVLLLIGLSGCAGDRPRVRLGALPCPGPFTLFQLGDPENLGVARYSEAPRFFATDEIGHGILYTEKAGFLDLAHLREAMDWSWYVAKKVEGALQRKQATLEFEGYDMCEFRLKFNYPDDWASMPAEQRASLITELSRRIGERVTLHAMTWHEITTWFGYNTTLVVSEKGSAFTYDDTMSHVIGIAAADRAMRSRSGTWDEDATRCLREELENVGVVSKERAEAAVNQVKGKWWLHGVCIRRMLDVGQNNNCIYPWLIGESAESPTTAPGEPGCEQLSHFLITTLNDINGRNWTGFWSMTIEPTLLIPSRVREATPGHPALLDPDRDFPPLIEQIRREVQAEFGPHADQPNDHWRAPQDPR